MEEHDIVYRGAPAPGEAAPAPRPAPAEAAWRRDIVPDDVLLFRYSALTFNGHRIHYDLDYCRHVEGYDGLVVHGPLLATVLAAGKTLEDFETAAQASSGLAVPTWTIGMVVPIGFGMLSLRLALNVIGYVSTLATGRAIKALPPISGTEEGAE